MSDFAERFDCSMTVLANARDKALKAKEATITCQENLKYCEADLFEKGLITGSNDKARAASVVSQTKHIRAELEEAERNERAAVLGLELALDTRRYLESLLKLMELEQVI